VKINDLPSNDSPPHRAPTSLGVITEDLHRAHPMTRWQLVGRV
jgi:hypothetical protein